MATERDLIALRAAAGNLAEAAFAALCDENIDYTRAQYKLVAALREFHATTGLAPDIEEWADR